MGSPDAELSILVTTDGYIQRLNRQWRCKDSTTDVLSFPMTGSGVEASPAKGSGPLLGDVVINADAASRQAAELRIDFQDEMARLLVHGIVHLMGYDHELGRAEAARMLAMERRVLSVLGEEWHLGAPIRAASQKRVLPRRR